MKFYRCLICGDVYMGKEQPTNCPFCGAQAQNLVPAEKWVDENIGLGPISEISQKNLQKALQLEVNNAPFYRDAMNKTRDVELQGIFKYLATIEQEHASVIKKILKCELPEPEAGKEVATDSDLENLTAAHKREEAATAFYREAALKAVEPRVKKVFTVLSEIESDHVALEKEKLG